MYSEKLSGLLNKSRLSIGDRVKIEKAGHVYEGLLMPKSAGDAESVVVKLDNGYNIGIKIHNGQVNIEKSARPEPKAVKEEEEFELGKIKKSLVKISFDPKKPKISLIATGGTVASRIDYRTGGVAALEDPREFLHNVPELAEIVNIENLLRPFTKMSEDMGYKDWVEIAKITARELNSGAKGLIITHGTDTLHYTAAALSFFLRNLSKPVILVGSQRSGDRGSSDAGVNLICSAHAAISDIAEIGICMHGEPNDSFCLLNRGTKVRKMHTSRRDAFRPINELPLAKIWPNGKIEKINKGYKKRTDGKVELDVLFEPKVAILKVHPNSEPKIIDLLVGEGYKGFVIEGTGLGHVPTFAEKSWIETIKKHSQKGIPFVITSQTIYGRVNPHVYTNLRILFQEAGAIPGEDITTETAYVKLGWVLGHTKDLGIIKQMMLTNYAGEISERTEEKSYLY